MFRVRLEMIRVRLEMSRVQVRDEKGSGKI